MLVLWEDMQEWIRREVRADALEGQARRRFALDPQIDRRNLMAMFDHGVSKVELAVELERPRLDRQGSRGCAGLCRLVDDADFHPELSEPERQDQARGTGANDQNVAVLHFVLRPSVSPAVGSSRPRSAARACWSASVCKSGGLAQTSRKSMAITI